MGELSEKYGRFDARIDTMQKSVDKLDTKSGEIDTKLSKLEKVVIRAGGAVAAVIVIVSALAWLYDQFKAHITIH
ncbi:hypothetical protein [Paraburkholderia sediminicola]|uniref:hypothetical protein n=1 Tax=Paraburkholderia sediminicola TaxID=458836 RepID=UPI0038B9A9B4